MRKQELGVLGRVAGIVNKWSSPRFYLAWWLVLFISLVPQLSAQTTSTITGTVHDKQGLTVAGAEVQVTSTELAIDRRATTEGDGTYRLAALPPGTYEIKVSKDGFQTELFRNIEVQQPSGGAPAVGHVQQYLPGREGQFGVRFDF